VFVLGFFGGPKESFFGFYLVNPQKKRHAPQEKTQWFDSAVGWCFHREKKEPVRPGGGLSFISIFEPNARPNKQKKWAWPPPVFCLGENEGQPGPGPPFVPEPKLFPGAGKKQLVFLSGNHRPPEGEKNPEILGKGRTKGSKKKKNRIRPP